MKGKLSLTITLLILFLFSWNASGEEIFTDTPTIDLNNAQVVNATIEVTFGDITVSGGATKLMEGEFQYSLVEWKPTISYQVRDTVGELKIEIPTNINFSFFNLGKNIRKSHIKLNDSIPMNLYIKVGAGKNQFLLGSMALESLSVETGAGEVMIDLTGNSSLSRLSVQTGVGKTTLDLQGNWTQNVEAKIISGMGEVTVYLPQNMGVKIETVKGLGSIDASNLIVDGNTYTNHLFGKTDFNLYIYLESGIGKVNLY